MLLDLIYVALFAVALPLWDYLVYWPAYQRQSQIDPAGARKRLWTGASIWPWALVAIGAALWVANGRSWASLGFTVPHGWRLWASVALFLLIAAYYVYAIATVARNADARAGIRKNETLIVVMPHTQAELYRWNGVALTAGFCEEFLYRGYFIWVFAPWLGWWGAAALSMVFFAAGHAYQGWKGVLHTGIVSTVFTLVVATFDSLWPAIALHAIVDLGSGVIAWLALREEPAARGS